MSASGTDPPANSPDHGERKCGFDMSYVKSIHGILKAKQIGWSFLAFLLACIAGSGVAVVFFIIATLLGWVSTLVIFFMFGTHNYKKITKFNWFLADILVCVVACILYVAIGIPVLISFSALEIASAVFGFIAVASYGVGIWYSFKRYQESKKRQKSDNQYAVDY